MTDDEAREIIILFSKEGGNELVPQGDRLFERELRAVLAKLINRVVFLEMKIEKIERGRQ